MDKQKTKALKAIYKIFCEDVITRHRLPETLSEYVRESTTYIF